MFGYDSLAGNIVISILQFRRDFGYPYGEDYVVSADWQLAFQVRKPEELHTLVLI